MAWDTPFAEFSLDDQLIWCARANAWYDKHKPHVESLLHEEKQSYPPSGSDCGKPELWKAGHWRWFFKLGNR
jgi:hypothetical protein